MINSHSNPVTLSKTSSRQKITASTNRCAVLTTAAGKKAHVILAGSHAISVVCIPSVDIMAYEACHADQTVTTGNSFPRRAWVEKRLHNTKKSAPLST